MDWTAPHKAHPDLAIAIIGIAVRLPDADTLGELDRNLADGLDSVRPLPAERLELVGADPADRYPDMAQIGGVEEFDFRFFGLAPAEAEAMDPQHRIVLQLACGAVENAGYRLSDVRERPTGVFLNTPRQDYAALVGTDDLLHMLGTAAPAMAGRTAYLLGLQGPAMTFDTGCSSSLVALRYACQELATGTVDLALAGGVSVQIAPTTRASAERFPEVMSTSGRCRAFDASANGTSQGEGGAILLLKRLPDAISDGDLIHATIRAVAVNHNGSRSNGLAAPGLTAQVAVVRDAWRQAGLDLRRLDSLEAHGSGTRLGDMIEIAAIQRVLSEAGAAPGACAIGSLKTNIGHLDSAAGLAGLVKAITAVKFGRHYPSLHFEEPNPQLRADGGQVRVSTDHRAWSPEDGLPRVAAVSSFSLTGTNAHAVVEEAPPEPPPTIASAEPDLATISAKSREALARYLRSVRERARTLNEGELPHALYVLNLGRDDHAWRAAFPVDGPDSFRTGLERALERVGDAEAAPARRLVLAVGFADPGDGTEWDASAFPEYRRVLEECGTDEPRARQYAFGRLLMSRGLRPAAVVGIGEGGPVARALRGEADIAVVLGEPARPSSPPIDPGRVSRLVARLQQDGPMVCCLLGDTGPLDDAVAAGGSHRVLRARTGGVADVLSTVAGLYEAGADIHWDQWYRSRPRRRVEMPTYPFERTRCWPERIRARAAAPEREEAAGREEAAERPALPSARFSLAEAEREVAAIWERVLKTTGVDRDSDYFELGGNSVLGLLVLDEFQREFGVAVNLPALYEHSTVAGLAEMIHAQRAGDAGRTDGSFIRPVGTDGPTPPSFGQEALWFLDRFLPDPTIYNVPVDVPIKGRLDLDAMRRAFFGLVERHDALRMRYEEVDGLPRVVVGPALPEAFQFLDLSGIEDADVRRARSEQKLREAAATPMDLARGPLFRGWLVRLAADDHTLLLVAHHSVYDGWTPAVIDRDLWEFYAAALEGRPADLPELPIGYADFAAWQRETMTGDRMAVLAGFWKDRLRGVRPLDLPAYRPRPRQPSGLGAHHRFTISAATMTALRKLGAAERATLFMTMVAAFDVLLHRYVGQDDITIGTTTAGRRHPDVKQLMGYFNNQLPLRADLSGDPSFRGVLRRVRTMAVEAMEHEELPFAKLVAAVEAKRDMSRTPIFQIDYTHQNQPAIQRQVARTGLTYHPDREEAFGGLPPGTAKMDLGLAVWEFEDRVELPAVLEYSLDLLDADDVADLAHSLVTLLDGIVADPDAPISALSLLGPEERRAILDRGRGRGGADRLASPLALFADWCRAAPDQVVIEGDDSALDLGEVRARARSTAATLRAHDVGSGTVVAGLLDGPDAIVGLLATLMVGATYVPLDPGDSFARLAGAIETAAPVLLLTNGLLADRLPWPGTSLLLGQDVPYGADDARTASAGGDGPHAGDLAAVRQLPEGAALSHRALGAACAAWGSLPERARIVVFEGGTPERLVDALTQWLGTRGTLVFAPAAACSSPRKLHETLARERADVVALPRPIHTGLEGYARKAGVSLEFPARLIVDPLEETAGELRESALRWGAGRLVAACRPAGVPVAMETPDPGADAPAWPDRHRFGPPPAEVVHALLDERGEPVPYGVYGDLCIGGAGAPSGPRAARVDDPGASEETLWRTGRRARWLRDGGIELEPDASAEDGSADGDGVPAAADPWPDLPSLTDRNPSDAVELHLTRAWVEILGCEVDRDDDFFTLGGHSLLAVRVLAEVRSAYGLRLPLTTMFEYPTVALLARLVRNQGAGVTTGVLVPIDPAGEAPPLYCVHPSGGNVMVYYRLARALGAGIPVYGLQAAGLYDDEEPDRTVAQMVDRYVAAVRERQPEGPYRLCGWSLGGVVAVEMARRLVADGQEVEFVGVIDATATFEGELPPDDDVQVLLAMLWMNTGFEVDPAEFEGLEERERFTEAVRLGQRVGLLPVHMSPDEVRSYVHIARLNDGSLVEHTVGRYPGRVDVFRARGAQHGRAGELPDLGWGSVATGGTEVAMLPGDHFSLMREHAAELAAAVRAALGVTDASPAVTSADGAGPAKADLSPGDAPVARLGLIPDHVPSPADPARPAVRPLRLDRNRSEALARLTPSPDAPAAALLAALAVLLARTTGERYVVVGFGAGAEDPRPVRLDLRDDPEFTEVVRRARAELDRAAEPGWFQAVLRMSGAEHASEDATRPGGLDLVWRVRSTDEGLRGALAYDAGRFGGRTVKRLAERLGRILERAVADPGTRVGAFPLMGERERRLLIEEWNRTATEREPWSVAGAVRRRAREAPDRVAVVWERRDITYRELDGLAARLAARLRDRGVGPESVVGVLMERSAELLVSALAVAYAGGVYLPLDPVGPPARIAYVVENSEPVLLLTRTAPPSEATAGAPVMRVGLDALSSDEMPATGSLPEPFPDNLAYVIYTSGTTGRPKGVAVTHRGLTNLLAWMQEHCPLEPGDRMAQRAPIGFDTSVWELFAPLIAGATVVVTSSRDDRDPYLLADLIGRERVTVIEMVPSMLRSMLVAEPDCLRGLHRMQVGGEELTPDVRDAFVNTSTAGLVNVYGPTETTVQVSFWDCREGVRNAARVPIGRPAPNTVFHVLDADLEPCPIGVPGELYVGGVGLARGYVGRPDTTAERFVPSPFGPPGSRLYRTGDRCRVTDGGVVEYLGRIDDQIQLRGYRIELHEVEGALRRHPAVREAAVTVRHRDAGDARLVAYVVPEGRLPGESELSEFLSRTLPEYMVPAHYVELGELPMTPIGKLDRRRLAELDEPIRRPPDTAVARDASAERKELV